MRGLKNIQTVLVATDFSEAADDAVAWAGRIAGPHRALVVVHHGLTPEESSSVDGYERAREKLDEIANELRRHGSPALVDLQSDVGPEGILRSARRREADLVVAGTRGATGLRRVLLGSTATRLVREAHVPVLIVPPSSRVPSTPIRRVLVPTDFAFDVQRAVGTLETVLGPATPEATVTLLHVHESSYQPSSPWSAPLLIGPENAGVTAATRRLESLARGLTHQLLGVDTVTCGGDPARAIEREAQYLGADLIVMGHGRASMTRLFRTSTVERVLSEAPCPVLSLRREAAAAASLEHDLAESDDPGRPPQTRDGL